MYSGPIFAILLTSSRHSARSIRGIYRNYRVYCKAEARNPAERHWQTISTIDEILANSRTIAVVGLSANPERPSNFVAGYLKEQGYKIVPVNPKEKTILGETSYPDLASVPEKIDIVEVFRRSEEVPTIVRDAIKIGAKAVWMQEGVRHDEAAAEARKAGLKVVMNKCMYKEHSKRYGDTAG